VGGLIFGGTGVSLVLREGCTGAGV
jgi:hypothetical protein